MAWQIILGVVLGIPMVLFPIALVWYLNVSGLYQVMRDARARQKRQAAREVKGVIAKKQVA
jgi:hypothetical protein